MNIFWKNMISSQGLVNIFKKTMISSQGLVNKCLLKDTSVLIVRYWVVERSPVHWTQALVFLISRVWVQVPILIFVS